MAQSALSIQEKKEVKVLIDKMVGQTQMVNHRRKDWIETKDKQLSVFITYSNSVPLFYDIDPADLKNWLVYPISFVVFVMNTHANLLIIPAMKIQQLVKNLPLKGNGETKLHITHRNGTYEFIEAPGVNFTEFYNNFSQMDLSNASIESTVVADIAAQKNEEEYWEGKKTYRLTNYYERNPKLRSAAILAHGRKCMVRGCGFDFEKTYGLHGNGFIEVHHTKPVCTLEGESAVNPISDMVVVCSNCHRMIHRSREKPLSIGDLEAILAKALQRISEP